MYLIVGLGNPGTKYENTRHNIGFQVVDKIVSKLKISDTSTKFNAQVYKTSINDKKIILIKPQTFMNDSGKSVSQFVNFYKVPIKNIFVIYDDIDMELGKFRIKSGGSDGGHNGIKSINSFITNDYIKIKIGIGHPGSKDLVSKYVLRPFDTKEDIEKLEELYNDISENLSKLLDGDLEGLSSQINNKQIKKDGI